MDIQKMSLKDLKLHTLMVEKVKLTRNLFDQIKILSVVSDGGANPLCLKGGVIGHVNAAWQKPACTFLIWHDDNNIYKCELKIGWRVSAVKYQVELLFDACRKKCINFTKDCKVCRRQVSKDDLIGYHSTIEMVGELPERDSRKTIDKAYRKELHRIEEKFSTDIHEAKSSALDGIVRLIKVELDIDPVKELDLDISKCNQSIKDIMIWLVTMASCEKKRNGLFEVAMESPQLFIFD